MVRGVFPVCFPYPGTACLKPKILAGCFFLLWAFLDLNQGPTDYESAALTN